MAYENIDIFEDEDLEVTVPTPKVMPTSLPGSMFPDAPILQNPDPEQYFKDLFLDKSYLEEYGTPTLTDEQIEAMYAPSDYSRDKRLALAQFGFGLMAPTRGGKMAPAISQAGQVFTQNLSKIKQLQRAEEKERQRGVLTAKLQKRGQEIADAKAVYDSDRGLRLNILNKKYDQDIASDKAKMTAYNDQMKAAKLKALDYEIEAFKPKKGQFRLPLENGEWSDPFVAYTVQEPGEQIQFYRPSDQLGEDGLPVLELMTDVAGIQEMTTAMSGTPSDYATSRGIGPILDIKNKLDTYDRNIMYLSDLRASIAENPRRAGFLAGLQMRAQDFGQIWTDTMNYTFNDFFKSGNPNVQGVGYEKGIQPNTKLVLISDFIDQYLLDPDTQKDIANGTVQEEDIAALRGLQSTFNQIGAAGQAEMRADFTAPGGNVVYGNQDALGRDLFESAAEQDKIMNKLKWFDEDLPLNQARANAIIYAIARARKSSGRLNLDDVERAAMDLNLFGWTSSVSVIKKLEFLESDLRRARMQSYSDLAVIPAFEESFNRMKELGYDTIDLDRIRKIGQTGEEAAGPKIEFHFEVNPEGSGVTLIK
jgi:hypothetical protein